MSNSKNLMVLLAALLACGTVFADTTSDQLTKIEAETLLLKAREKQLDVQASILAKQNEIAAKQTVGTVLTQTSAAMDADPVVRGIEGIGDTVYVTLQLSDGSVIDAQEGDVLSNGMHVVSITPSSVIVQKGKKRTRLATYAPRPAQFNPSIPAPGLNLPLTSAPPRVGMK